MKTNRPLPTPTRDHRAWADRGGRRRPPALPAWASGGGIRQRHAGGQMCNWPLAGVSRGHPPTPSRPPLRAPCAVRAATTRRLEYRLPGAPIGAALRCPRSQGGQLAGDLGVYCYSLHNRQAIGGATPRACRPGGGVPCVRLTQLHDIVHVDISLESQHPVGRYTDVLVDSTERSNPVNGNLMAELNQSAECGIIESCIQTCQYSTEVYDMHNR